MTEPKPAQCLNCEAALTGDYCAKCGQKVGPARPTLLDLSKQLIVENFELDGRVPRTLVPFFFKPGFLSLEYNAGRKRSYTSPLRLFLAAGVLWVIVGFGVEQWRDFHPQSSPDQDSDAIAMDAALDVDEPDEADTVVNLGEFGDTRLGRALQSRVDSLQALPSATRSKRFRDAAAEIPPTVALALFPVFALFLKTLMLGSGRTYPEHAVFALHVHAFGIVLMSVVRLIGDDRLIAASFAIFGAYVFIALRRAYDLGWWSTTWRWGLLSLLFVVITGSVFLITLLSKALAS